MDYKERITRLLEQGVITRAQSERLAGRLIDRPQREVEARRPTRGYHVWALVAVVVLLAALSIGVAMNPEPIQLQGHL